MTLAVIAYDSAHGRAAQRQRGRGALAVGRIAYPGHLQPVGGPGGADVEQPAFSVVGQALLHICLGLRERNRVWTLGSGCAHDEDFAELQSPGLAHGRESHAHARRQASEAQVHARDAEGAERTLDATETLPAAREHGDSIRPHSQHAAWTGSPSPRLRPPRQSPGIPKAAPAAHGHPARRRRPDPSSSDPSNPGQRLTRSSRSTRSRLDRRRRPATLPSGPVTA